MGCDIHCCIEYKSSDHWWSLIPEFNPGRNYALFALMAGVRDYGDQKLKLFEPRGLPDRVQWEAREAYEKWGSDAHTPSWLQTEELEKVIEAYSKKWPEEKDRPYWGILALMKELKEARIVFWFDN